jgi:lipopolysaccharide export system protein LptC
MRSVSAKNFSISLLLTIALALSAWSILLLHTANSKTTSTDPKEADSYMQDVVATIFNPQGNPSLIMTSAQMTHFPENDTTQITAPYVTVYRQSPKPWYINSNHAQATHGISEILFSDNVNIRHPADIENPTTTMTTATLTIFPSQQVASTDQAIVFMQPDTVIHAVGMLANLDNGTIKLLSQTKGEYVPIS